MPSSLQHKMSGAAVPCGLGQTSLVRQHGLRHLTRNTRRQTLRFRRLKFRAPVLAVQTLISSEAPKDQWTPTSVDCSSQESGGGSTRDCIRAEVQRLSTLLSQMSELETVHKVLAQECNPFVRAIDCAPGTCSTMQSISHKLSESAAEKQWQDGAQQHLLRYRA